MASTPICYLLKQDIENGTLEWIPVTVTQYEKIKLQLATPDDETILEQLTAFFGKYSQQTPVEERDRAILKYINRLDRISYSKRGSIPTVRYKPTGTEIPTHFRTIAKLVQALHSLGFPFLQINSAVAVNQHYVRNFNRKEVMLLGMETYQFSKNRSADIFDQLCKFSYTPPQQP